MFHLAGIRRNRLLPVLGGLLFLLATGIPTLERMHCLKAGISVIHVGTIDDCCANNVRLDHATVQPKCCDVSTVSSNIQDYVIRDRVVLDLPVAVELQVVASPTVHSEVGWNEHAFAVAPPPISMGRHLATIGRLIV